MTWLAARKIARWVEKEMTPNYDVGFASAREIIENKEGDCSEHTVLTVTLCRAVGIPARAAVGIMYAWGFFAYHMWPEVYVGRWIGLDAKWLAIDKISKEYYTDATHIKFGRSNLDENIFKESIKVKPDVNLTKEMKSIFRNLKKNLNVKQKKMGLLTEDIEIDDEVLSEDVNSEDMLIKSVLGENDTETENIYPKTLKEAFAKEDDGKNESNKNESDDDMIELEIE